MAGTNDLKTLAARTADGSGNNIDNPTWGAADTQFIRLADANYADGVGTIRQGPNAREISNTISREEQTVESAFMASDLFTFFGQFLDHDIDLTPAASGEQISIPIPANDPIFDQNNPITLTRSTVADGTGVTGTPREQINKITSFVDASNIYGSSADITSLLRADKGASANLLMGEDDSAPTLGQLRAIYPDLDQDHPDLIDGGGRPDLFVGGDIRINENSALISMHTVWIREHNYQVDRLREDHPDWTEDEIFDAARVIVEAEYQNIVFNEYVPFLLGTDNIPEYQGYDPTINASISTEFATAAYRLGHSQLSSIMHRVDEDGSDSAIGHLKLADAFFTPSALGGGDGVDPLVRGLTSSTGQQVDENIVDDVRNLLFGQGGPGSDLASLNIMRGRDHGIATLNDMRSALGLDPYNSFSDLTSNAILAAQFAAVYASIDEVDLWVGGLAEQKVAGSQLGETFHAIVLDQFLRLRDGDRFYFENRLAEFPELLDEIKDVRYSDILVRTTGIDHLQDDVFVAHNRIAGTDHGEYMQGTDKHDLMMGYDGQDQMVGGEGDDDIYGGDGRDYLRGLAGNDVVKGDGGKDVVEGGHGNDHLDGGDGNDWMHGGHGDDHMVGGDGHDVMRGGDGRDTMAGDVAKTMSPDQIAGHDTVKGGDGDDILIGDAATMGDGTVGGNDYISGGKGNDKIYGDGIEMTGTAVGGDDTLKGGHGDDFIDGGGGDYDRALFHDVVANYKVSTDDDGVTTVMHFFSAQDGTDTLTNVELLVFADRTIRTEDTVTNPGDPAEIRGTDGDDVYVGTQDADIYVMSKGKDTVQGYEKGTDKLHFGELGASHIYDLWGSFNDHAEGHLVIGDYHGNRVTIEGVKNWDEFEIDDMTF